MASGPLIRQEYIYHISLVLRLMSKKSAIITTAICYTLFITILSTVDLSDGVEHVEVPHVDKAVHFCFYFIMSILLAMVVLACRRSNDIKRMLLATSTAIGYSIGIEIVQIYIGRSFDLLDILANSMGAIGGLLIIRQSTINSYIRQWLHIS